MADRFKLVYVGACSHRFSIGLFRNIVASNPLHPMNVVLVDIDERLLTYVHKILRNMADKAKVDIRVESTTDRRKAFEDADFIYLSISVGAQESEWTDIHIPLKFGIPQNTGDTVGPGGIFRGLRSIEKVRSIRIDLRKRKNVSADGRTRIPTKSRETVLGASLKSLCRKASIGEKR